ncbi:MAG: CHAD domain-containing protein [Gammaproteobacteria bacterium]|nr:MAG: CHAD domain-containing protein [Gammaproteobacteria bacterium]
MYPLPAQRDGLRALESLEGSFSTLRESSPVCHEVYLDTFDWRLHHQGLRLHSRGCEGLTALALESDHDRLECRLANGTPPAFAADLPAGAMHERIAPLIELRRLLPLARLETTGHTLRVLDDQEKTVARVVVEYTTVTTPGTEESVRQLAPILRVLPVRGYPGAARRVTRHLEKQVGLAPGDRQPLDDALQAVGRRPGEYSSKLTVGISRDLRAEHAAAIVCRRLLDNMVANEDGVRRDLDQEFLHDFRVSVRCTRSALAQLEKVFPRDAATRFRREFKWLGSVTGAVRDLDVYLLKMDEYRASLPADAAEDLAPLNAFLRRHRSAERRRLVAALRSRRYCKLVENWRAFLDSDADVDSAPADARRSVVEVACARIWRAYRRIHRHGRKIDADTPAESLHELRIDCKKLRYLLEFFYSLYDEDDIAPLLKSLKRLQDNLGDFNDLEVQQRTLQQFAHQMEEEGLASVNCLLAMGRLLDHLLHRQANERRRFATCFKRFSVTDNRTRFKRLFNPPPRACE